MKIWKFENENLELVDLQSWIVGYLSSFPKIIFKFFEVAYSN